MRSRAIFGGLLLLAASGTWNTAMAREVPIQRGALPAPVNAALSSRYPGAKVLSLTRESAKGVVVSEAELEVSGRRGDALYESDGALREEEAVVADRDLPEPVRGTLAASPYAKWKIARAERITSGAAAAPMRYGLLVRRGSRRVELVYASDGRQLSAKKVTEKD